MQTLLLLVELIVSVGLIVVILLQRSEGGALGMSGGGPGAFMTARGTGDLLTRTTQILAAIFFSLCLAMTLISGHTHGAGSLVDKLKLNALGATSSEKPLSGAPGLPGGPLGNPTAPFRATGPAPFGSTPAQPQPQGNSLNLLGSPQTPLAAPAAHPSAAAAPKPAAPTVAVKPAASSAPPAKVAASSAPPAKPKAPKPAATPKPAAASAAPPAVTPAPLVVPPPPAPTPAPSAAGNAASGQ
jgi:preprotein translocase subunit SecG